MDATLKPYPFATIGFRPFLETGEFVTVGVVAYDFAQRAIAFEIEDARRTSRVAGLFPNLDLGVFRAAMHAAREELEAVRKTLGAPGPVLAGFADAEANVFRALTAPREGMIFYPVQGRRMAINVEEAARGAFRRYVHREDLVPHERTEEVMAKAIRDLAERLHVGKRYRPNVVVGNDLYRARFTLGHYREAAMTPDRVLRPLDLDRADSTEIYRHGDTWIARLRRLRQFDLLPPLCVLTLRGPGAQRPDLAPAFQEVREELTAQHATCVDETDEVRLAECLRLDQSGELALAG